METSSQTNVLKSLLAARRQFAPVLKNKENSHFRSKYADLDAVLDAVSPALGDAGLVLVQRTECDGPAVTLVTELIHAETGERITSRYPLVPARPNDPQALGGCLTYARRYCALALLGIAAEDDDGQQASRPPQKASPPAERAARQQPPRKPTEQELDDTRVEIGNCERLSDLTRLYEGSPALVREALKGDFTRRKEQIQEQLKARKEARNGATDRS